MPAPEGKGRYDRWRGTCDHCGMRRLVTPCPCPICQRASFIVMCEECEREELELWMKGDDVSKHTREIIYAGYDPNRIRMDKSPKRR